MFLKKILLVVILFLPLLIYFILAILGKGEVESKLYSVVLFVLSAPYSIYNLKKLIYLEKFGVVVEAKIVKTIAYFKGAHRIEVEFVFNHNILRAKIYSTTIPNIESKYNLLIDINNFKNYIILSESHL